MVAARVVNYVCFPFADLYWWRLSGDTRGGEVVTGVPFCFICSHPGVSKDCFLQVQEFTAARTCSKPTASGKLLSLRQSRVHGMARSLVTAALQWFALVLGSVVVLAALPQIFGFPTAHEFVITAAIVRVSSRSQTVVFVPLVLSLCCVPSSALIAHLQQKINCMLLYGHILGTELQVAASL